MTGLGPLFDLDREEHARDVGKLRALEGAGSTWLERGQEGAALIGQAGGDVTIDDVHRLLEAAENLAGREYEPAYLARVAGSVFVPRKLWRFTGRVVKSRRRGRHASSIRVWRYEAEAGTDAETSRYPKA